ncbi:acyl carrier protein [Marinobacterium aestuariivivens]|uniref:Acyl carrier protein n=1 Tax=Marinobacterium aestuariivivens TaxID=1698799 RepID=A0ABW2A3F8_9GAMM
MPNDRAGAEPAATLLQLIDELSSELRPGQPKGPVLLDSTLDGDLGLDSLSRAELFSRIEQRFRVSLPGQTFAEAETPRDLLRALARAAPWALSPTPHRPPGQRRRRVSRCRHEP